MAPVKPKGPKLVTLGISYMLGTKVNLGDFESADVRLSKDEKWDVSDLTPDQAKALWKERYSSMKHDIDALVEKGRAELLGEDQAAQEEAAR